MSARIVIGPGMKFGAPAIDGTRIDPDLVATYLLAYDIDEVISNWPHLTRDDVLVACWYAARYGRPKDWVPKERRRLLTWLDANEEAMWRSEDWSEVPLP